MFLSVLFIYTMSMKTAVSDHDPQHSPLNYLIFGLGLLCMFAAFVLLLVMIAPAEQTAVLPTAVSTIKPMQTTADPVQIITKDNSAIIWQRDTYQWELTPRADFKVAGRVLTRKTYNNDWQSEASPLDLAIGWGELNDTRADNWVNWSQSGRWYYFRWHTDSPYKRQYISTHSSNFHIIPATESLESVLLKIREDDRIILEGQLVDVAATGETESWKNQTSLTRTDSGNGACEILLVKQLIWNGQEYH